LSFSKTLEFIVQNITTASPGSVSRKAIKSAATIAAAYALLTIASKISIAIGPVPLTMQTAAVGLIGALLGARMGALAVAFWVMTGFMGAPVFATPMNGLAALFGPTAGFLVSFPLAAGLAGYLAEKGFTGKRFIASFFNQAAANLFILAFGTLWLAASFGLEKAFVAGCLPFISGAFIKATLTTAVLYGIKLYRK
jgi:biotin transport system substrate-specific component